MTKPIFLLALFAAAYAAESGARPAARDNIRLLIKAGDYVTAMEKAKALNKQTPDDVATYQILAEAQLGLGDYEDAEMTIQWMLDLRIGKADAMGWYVVAKFREAVGDLEGSLDAVNLAYGRVVPGQQPDIPTLLIYSARLQMKAGRLENAEAVLKSMPAGTTTTEQNQLAIAELRIQQQRQAEAVGILKSLSKTPGNLYLLSEQTKDAADYKAFETAALEQKDKWNAELTLYYAGAGDRARDAVKLAKQEAAKRHDVGTLDRLAFALYQAGQKDEARVTMKSIVKLGNRDPEVLRHAALMGVAIR